MSTVRASSASPSTSRKAVKATATSSAPTSRPPTRASDPYYGHEETSIICARFITSLFQCPDLPPATLPGAPSPRLAHFVAYALHRTRLPNIVTFAALQILQRLKTRFPAARGSSGHRLFISAFMIASKIICDDTYSNQSWGIVAQKMFALKEINQMEREMCGYLEWNLNITSDVLEFEEKVRYEHAPSKSRSTMLSAVPSPILVTPSSTHYPTPESTPNKYHYTSASSSAYPSPAQSPLPPTFASANSSLASSPVSDDCQTPSPVTMTQSSHPHHSHSHSHHAHHHSSSQHHTSSHGRNPKGEEVFRHIHPQYPITAGGW